MTRIHERPGWIAGFALLVAFAILYRNVVASLVDAWAHDDNYSHGFLIVPVAAFFVWERRRRLRETVVATSIVGLVVILSSLLTLVAGVLGAELLLTRVSMIGVLAGTVLFVLGWSHLRILALPLSFLILMVPIPAIVFNQIAFPLQLLASQFGERALNLASVPVLREGNVMILANTSLYF
jgi:exosortase